ncbi:LPS assembly protein LptD [bacterium]|nr:LPS assembly protein LptD [bacterium]
MSKKFLSHFKFIFYLFLLIASNPIQGQELPVSLISNKINYDKISGVLKATGNVKVVYENTELFASEIIYNSNTDELLIIGKFEIFDGNTVITSTNNTIINAKLKNGLIKGARVMINNKLQLSAEYLEKVDENYNIFNTVVASTCIICANNPIPFWQIRARTIIHNKEKQKLYFKNARLDLLGLPILYIPTLNIPEPGISRASGLLVPQFSSSNKIGFSTKIPYYIVLDKHKDITLTPYITSKNSFIIETDYRQYTKKGYFELSNALLLRNNFNQEKINGFIESNGSFKLRKNYITDYNIDLANEIDFNNGEKPFKNNYNYAKLGDDRLKNTFNISKTTSNSFFRVGASYTQSFRYKDFDGDGVKEEDPNVPLILPELYFKKNYNDNKFGGKYSFLAQSINLTNLSVDQYSRIGGKLDWKKNWQTTKGFEIGALSQFNANTYFTQNHFYKNFMPLGMLEARYPLKKSTKKMIHMFEPISQLIFSPNKLIGYQNNDQNTSDSTTAEFEETNLFSINRFPGFDDVEAGIRVNIGARYTIFEPNGWELTSTAGRVLRQKDLNQFDKSKSTGLNKINSDYVSALSLKFPQNFKISTRLLFNENLHVSKNETNLNFSSVKYTTSLGYVWLDKQSILNLDKIQNELTINTDYNVRQNWKLGAGWRQNLEARSPILGKFYLVFENNCAKVNFSLKLKYKERNIVNRIFGMQIFLSGIGSNANKKKFNNTCRSY